MPTTQLPDAKEYQQSGRKISMSDPIVGGAVVVPADGADLATNCRAVYVGVSGDITGVTVDGSTLTFKDVPVGIFPVQFKRIKSTGTDATDMIALF